MHYFKWEGIDQHGVVQSGSASAASLTDLEAQLASQRIALLHARRQYFTNFATLSSSAKLLFWEQLCLLLKQNILIDKALQIAQQQTSNVHLKNILSHISHDLTKGISLRTSAAHFPELFDQFSLTMLEAGSATGALAHSCTLIFAHLEQRQAARKLFWAAAAGPLITLGMALAITLLLLLVAVPQFEVLFADLEHGMPHATRVVIRFHHFLFSWLGASTIAAVTILSCCAYAAIKRRERLQTAWDSFLVLLPGIGSFILHKNLISYLQTAQLLHEGGIFLKSCFAQAEQTITNKAVLALLHKIPTELEHGVPLAQALQQLPPVPALAIFKSVLGSAVAGSNELSQGFTISIKLYQQKLDQQLQLMKTLLQPMLLMIVALFVFFILLALYLPLFNLANTV